MAVFDLKNATLKLIDGSSVPNTLTIKMAEGNLQYTEKVDRQFLLDRGELDEVRNGDQQPMELSFEGRWDFIKGDADITIEDFLKFRGGASAYVSSNGSSCGPKCVDVELEHTPLCSTEKIETIVFPDFYYEELGHDAKAAQISVKGRCNATEAVSTRTSQT